MSFRVPDDLGRERTLGKAPSRIVSLVPSLTEAVFALGAGARLAGVTDFCNHPPEARGIPRVGGVLDPAVEAIRSLSPDLILASVSENRRETVRALENHGLAVHVTDPTSVDGALRTLERLGLALDLQRQGAELAARLREDLASIPNAPPPLPVFFPVWETPLYAPGRGTFVADLLRRAGALSVTETLGSGWPVCTLEFVREAGTRAVLLPSEPHPFDEADRVRWESLVPLPYAPQGGIFLVDGERTNRPGPRLVEGVRLVREIVDQVSSAGGRNEADET
ncbi:MAG: helical backbone metal receptor [Planctomycetota bacterium]